MPVGRALGLLSNAVKDDKEERVSVRMPDGTVLRNVPRGTPKAEIERKWKDAKLQRQVAENPILGPVTSAMSGAADMFTLGMGDEIRAGLDTVNPFDPNSGWRQGFSKSFNQNLRREQNRDEQLQRNSPNAHLLGQVAGAVAPAIATGGGSAVTQAPRAATAAPGMVARAAQAARPTAMAAAQGGAYAFGNAKGDVGDRLKEVPEGMAYGAVGDVAGRALGAGLARAIGGPKLSAAQRALVDEDVLLTPGMRGGQIKRTIEDQVMGSIPGLDTAAAAAQERSFTSLRKAVANRVLAPIGRNVDDVADLANDRVIGEEFAGNLNKTVYEAYDNALDSLNLQATPQLTQSLDDVVNASRLSLTDDELKVVVNNVADLKQKIGNKPLTGRLLRQTVSGLRERASKLAGKPQGDALRAVGNVVEEALDAQNGSAASAAYKSAREAVSLLKRFEDAASRAGTVGGQFGPTQLRQAAMRRGFGTSNANIASGQAPLMDIANNAAEVMRVRSANSGTIPRAWATGGLAAGPAALGAVDPTMGAILASQTAGYIPGVDRVLQDIAVKRPAGLLSISDALRRNQRALGLLGTGSALGVYGSAP